MTTRSTSDASSAKMSIETKRCLRDLVRAAVLRLSETPNQTLESEVHTRWERGRDGHFRESTARRRRWLIDNDFLRSLPGYAACVQQLMLDPIIEHHLDRLVGTSRSAFRMEAEGIVGSVIHSILADDDGVTFSEEGFERTWLALAEFLGAERFACTMVAPLPNLCVRDFPLRLNDELVLDSFTEDEVTRCCQVGVLRPVSPQFPLIEAAIAVGIRRTTFLPKRIETGDEPRAVSPAPHEGSLGRRPTWRDDLVVNDVLSALRLFNHNRISSTGHVSWAESRWYNSGMSFRVLQQWPYWGKYELSAGEIAPFLELWRLLEEGTARFGFSTNRFNLAFDRGLLADRIVDLVIAAESLLLGDPERGELGFRFALRAAKFIEHPDYGENDVYRLMRHAYDARSAIVHGGSPRLPSDPSADLSTFSDTIEELVRRGLRKALAMKQDGQKLRQADYWLNLLLASPGQ